MVLPDNRSDLLHVQIEFSFMLQIQFLLYLERKHTRGLGEKKNFFWLQISVDIFLAQFELIGIEYHKKQCIFL